MSGGAGAGTDAEVELIGALYDSAAGDTPWSGTLQRLGGFVDGKFDMIVRSARTHELVLDSQGRPIVDGTVWDTKAIEFYASHYAAVDQLAQRSAHVPRNQPWLAHQLVDIDDFRQSEIYNEWYLPTGCHQIIGCAADLGDHGYLAIAVSRLETEEAFGTEELRRAEHLIPHIRRAADLRLRLAHCAALRDLAWATVDALTDAVVAIDARGHVLHHNEAAEALRENGALSNRVPGRPPFPSHRPVRTQVGGRTYSWVYRPVPPRAARSGAVAFVFISELLQSGQPDAAWLKARFELTPAEARLVLGLLDGESIRSFAEAHDVRESTCRSQLKAAFNKTNTRRQGELIALVLRALPRVRHDEQG